MEHELSQSNSNTEILKSALESEKTEFEQQMEGLRAINTELSSKVDKSEQDKISLATTISVSGSVWVGQNLGQYDFFPFR